MSSTEQNQRLHHRSPAMNFLVTSSTLLAASIMPCVYRHAALWPPLAADNAEEESPRSAASGIRRKLIARPLLDPDRFNLIKLLPAKVINRRPNATEAIRR